jgi:hypothetical protein
MDELAALLEAAGENPETPEAKRLIAAVGNLPIAPAVTPTLTLRALQAALQQSISGVRVARIDADRTRGDSVVVEPHEFQ